MYKISCDPNKFVKASLTISRSLFIDINLENDLDCCVLCDDCHPPQTIQLN